MAKRDMKKALGASLKAEEQAVKSRFQKAKTVRAKKAVTSRSKAKTVRAKNVSVPSEQPKPDEAVPVMRDSLPIRNGEEEMIARITRRCMKAGISVNQSDVSRAGLAALDSMKDRELETLFESLQRAKKGRPRPRIRIFVVHREAPVKLRQPIQIKRLQFARRVIIANRIVTVRWAA